MSLAHPRTGSLFGSPVPPGTGWPGDPATARTAVASAPAQVAAMALAVESPAQLDAEVSVCRACPRLVEWREQTALTKRRSFADQPYWGRPVPGWGAERPRLMIVGLAPAAHGGNRTGRVFTGDRSGDVLYAAMYRAGLANSPISVDAADGLTLNGTRVVAAVRCAPPDNSPTPAERATCAPWLTAEWRLTGGGVRVIVALGGFGWRSSLDMVRSAGGEVPRPQPKFGHGAAATLRTDHGEVVQLGCYHPSQQNTFTGKLTTQMLDDVFGRAAAIAGLSG
ncbi:MAG TPA: uracil-DNA glycosylase [Mycobacterium sp.]|uniref:uracil-DNA glycosylase n=1 Tax=Mycobacterium sp. TaxID=1785 RepID=UPI002D6463E8|nr:uracil-DNA glycosylase [Mycobacterium sp.]HXY66509.1 uracil-DNA glycosylase [Mycobacterium sp.]